MKKPLFVTVMILLMGIRTLFALEAVEVANLSFKILARETQTFYYGFAEGDTIVINVEPIKGEDISGIIIREWPSSVKFQDTKTRLVDKKIAVPLTAVYSFELANTGLFRKIYELSIKRIHSSEELVNFNTGVTWETVYDTTYSTVVESTLVKVDSVPEKLVDTQKKISAGLSSSVKVSLPEGTSYWVYWIGVGKEAAEGLQGMVDLLPEVAKMVGIVDPVIGFALGYVSKLYTLNSGLDINYTLERYSYGNWVPFKYSGGVITDYAKMDKPINGSFYIKLDNSYSLITPKIVTVKVVAVKIIPQYEIKTVQRPRINKTAVPRVSG